MRSTNIRQPLTCNRTRRASTWNWRESSHSPETCPVPLPSSGRRRKGAIQPSLPKRQARCSGSPLLNNPFASELVWLAEDVQSTSTADGYILLTIHRVRHRSAGNCSAEVCMPERCAIARIERKEDPFPAASED